MRENHAKCVTVGRYEKQSVRSVHKSAPFLFNVAHLLFVSVPSVLKNQENYPFTVCTLFNCAHLRLIDMYPANESGRSESRPFVIYHYFYDCFH